MSTPQEQYFQVMQQSQDAVLNAVTSWSKTVQDAAGSLPAVTGQVDPSQVVDQVFDFAEKMLEMQRDFAKNLMQGAASLSESITSRSAEAASTAAQAASSTAQAATPRA